MGAYEDLLACTVEVVLRPGQPLTLTEIAAAANARGTFVSDLVLLEVILRASPERFIEVAPGTWVRRADGPEAGVPARPRRPPLAGRAAVALVPPAQEGG